MNAFGERHWKDKHSCNKCNCKASRRKERVGTKQPLQRILSQVSDDDEESWRPLVCLFLSRRFRTRTSIDALWDLENSASASGSLALYTTELSDF